MSRALNEEEEAVEPRNRDRRGSGLRSQRRTENRHRAESPVRGQGTGSEEEEVTTLESIDRVPFEDLRERMLRCDQRESGLDEADQLILGKEAFTEWRTEWKSETRECLTKKWREKVLCILSVFNLSLIMIR